MGNVYIHEPLAQDPDETSLTPEQLRCAHSLTWSVNNISDAMQL